MSVTILTGDALAVLKTLPDRSVCCCVTSPPYWGLRSYLPKDHPLKPLELGQEKTPEEYVQKLVDGTVLDPFGGSGCVGMVAKNLGRKAILIDLNPEYKPLMEERCHMGELV